MSGISIIVPLAPGETLWQQLLVKLILEKDDEVLLAATTPPPSSFAPMPALHWLQCSQPGRAAQMNTAAAEAKNSILWFVHADSRPVANAIPRLRQAFEKNKEAIYYFDLRFYDGGIKMRLNEIGVRLRCGIFDNPFGDQALAISKRAFQALGGFDKTAAYGEDHLLVLHARRQGIRIKRIGATIGTSARRYDEYGWWRTVFLFQRLWMRQWRNQ